MEPHLVVNGQSRPLGEAGAHLTLLEWLRAGGLTGGKEGCAEGECGACAVLVARPDADGSRWTAINACLAPVAALDGQEVITSEGLGSRVRCIRCSRRWPTAADPSAATAPQASSARWPPSSTAATGGPTVRSRAVPSPIAAAHAARPRARAQRLRPARPQRQPVPVHRLSADPRRRVRARPARRRRPAAGPVARARARRAGHRTIRHGRRRLRPADIADRGAGADRRAAGRPAAGRLHRLGRRAEPPARPRPADRGHRPARRAAPARGARRRDRDRRRPQPDRDRTRAGRPGAAARRPVPPVRLPADPQHRHARRQPRHRLADRRQPAGAARPGRRAGAGLRPGGAGGAVGRLLHRLPPDPAPARRADQDRPDPAPAGADLGLPQDRQTPVRRHLQHLGRLRAGAGRRHGALRSGSASAGWPRRRSGRGRPRRC